MAALEDSRGNKVRELQSSFGMHVETLPWVPASQEHVVAQETGNCSTFRETFLSRGSELFMPILNIKSLLTHHVAYFCCPTRSPSLFLQYLKVRQSVDVEFVKEKFKEWGKEQESEDKNKYLCTSLTHIKMIYRYLQDNLPPKQLQDLLMDMPFVFLPKPKLDLASMQDLIVAGRLLRRKDVRWRDPTGLFQKYTESLESANLPSANKTSIHHLYSSLVEFFLRSGRVEEEPEIEDYVSLLKHLSSSFPVSKVLSDVHQIFSTLGSMLRTAITDPDQNITVVKLNSAKTKLKSEAVIPVRNNKWVKLSEEPMIADDRQLERMFAGRGEKGVYFVETSRRFVKNQMGPRLPKPQSAKEMAEQEETMIEFLESFGVKKLSNCINIMYSPEMFFPCPEIQQYVRDVVPYIQRDLLTEFPNTYEQLKAKGMSESLSKAAFGRVDKLEVVYSLKHLPNEVAKTSANCRFTDNYEFYVLKAHVENYSEINGELARFFSCGDNNVRDEIRSLLIEILPLMQSHRSTDLEDLLERNDITSLPESEAPWTVPEPVFAIPEPEQDDGYMDVDEGDADELLVKFKPKRSDAGGGVPSWPPKSSQMDPKVLAGQPSTRPAPIWPPPATPAHSQTRSGDLSHLRPAREDLVKMRQDAEKEGGKEGGAEMERSPSVASNDTSYSGLSHRSGPPGPGSQYARPHGPPHGPPRSPSGDYHPSSHPHPTERQYSGEPRPPGTSDDRPLGEHSSPHPHGYSGHVRPEGDSYEGQTGSANPSPVHTPGGKVDPGRKRPRVESDSSLDLNRSQLDQSALNQSNLWFDPPIWRGEGEIPYEEVGKEKGLKFEALADLPENSENEIVGRWGETIVYEYLQSHFEKDPSVVKIRWMNEQRETGLPYDLEVHFYDEEKQITNLVYVEVKATLKDKKAGFLISANEVKFAMDLKDNYHLYRVFNAGNTESVRLTKLENLALHLSEGAIKLFMVV